MTSLPPMFDPSTTPVSPPPPGQMSNFIDPPSVAWGPRFAVYLTLPLMLLFALLRLYVRFRTRHIGPDDYVLIFALISAIGYNGLLLHIYMDEANGRHSWDTPLTVYTISYFKSNFSTIILYNFTAAAAKTSLFTLYLRIFKPSRTARITIWAGIVITLLLYVVVTILTLTFLVPRPGDGGWGSTKTNTRSAAHSGQILAASGVGGTLTDYYAFCLPLYFVWNIVMRLDKKIGVGCLFLAGLVPCVSSTVGAVFRFRFLFTTGVDGTWVGTQMQALSIAELNTGILCCSVPVAVGLFKKTYRWIESSLSSFRQFLVTGQSGQLHTQESSTLAVDATPQMLSEKIPRGFITGLRSFIQYGNGASSSKTVKVTSDDSIPSYAELSSIDYERFGRA